MDQRGPSVLLLAVLAAVFLLTAALVYQALDATRSHKVVARSVVEDYSHFAAAELARRMDASAMRTLLGATMRGRVATRAVLGEGERASDDSLLLAFSDAAEDEFLQGGVAESVIGFIVVRYSSRDVQATSAISPGSYDLLASAIANSAHRAMTDKVERRFAPAGTGERLLMQDNAAQQPVIFTYTSLGGRPVVIAATLELSPSDEPYRIYGIVINPAIFARVLAEQAIRQDPLLPTTLTRGAANDKILAVQIQGAVGPAWTSGAYAQEDLAWAKSTLTDPALEGQTVRVAVDPSAADTLVIGGLPASRLPLLLATFALTLLLIGVALVQVRRQQMFIDLRTRFVTGVSHELRTPLAQIRIYADLLVSEQLNEQQRTRSTREIGHSVRRLTMLVDNLLRFARIGPGQEPLRVQTVEIEILLEDIVETYRPLAEAEGMRVYGDFEQGLTLSADQFALRQAVLNLLDNAVKYGNRGQEVRVTATRVQSGVRIAVEDEGPGVPEADRARVWEPYVRLDRYIENVVGGSGIGLSLVRDVVEKHGGGVSIESRQERGATFVIWLPHAQTVGISFVESQPLEGSA